MKVRFKTCVATQFGSYRQYTQAMPIEYDLEESEAAKYIKLGMAEEAPVELEQAVKTPTVRRRRATKQSKQADD